jgi:hypothetical protein
MQGEGEGRKRKTERLKEMGKNRKKMGKQDRHKERVT